MLLNNVLKIQEMLILFYIEKFKIFWKLQNICIFAVLIYN